MNDNALFNKVPPHSPEAEMCALASMMLDPQFLDEALAFARAEWFYAEDHIVIFTAIASLRAANRKVDAIILKDELARMGKLDEIGGVKYLGELLHKVPSAGHGNEYFDSVRRNWIKRQQINIGLKLLRTGYDATIDGAKELSAAVESIAAVVADGEADSRVPFAKAVDEAIDALSAPAEVRSKRFVELGFPSLDAVVTGIGEGEVVHLGARPSMGKSTLLRQMAVNVAATGRSVLYLSLEESPAKIARNVLSWKTQITNTRIRSGNVNPAELASCRLEAVNLRSLPITVIKGVNDATRLRAIVASAKARGQADLVILDFLQRVEAGGKSDYERVTFASNAITGMTRELGLRTLAAVALSREVTHRDDKRPRMEDVKSSGQIESDSDVLMLLHREDYYHIGEPHYQPTQTAEVIFAKVRDGERGHIAELRSHLDYQCFEEIKPAPQELFVDENF